MGDWTTLSKESPTHNQTVWLWVKGRNPKRCKGVAWKPKVHSKLEFHIQGKIYQADKVEFWKEVTNG